MVPFKNLQGKPIDRRGFLLKSAMAAGTATCLASAAPQSVVATTNKAEPWRGVHVMAWGPAAGMSGLPLLKRAIDEVLKGRALPAARALEAGMKWLDARSDLTG